MKKEELLSSEAIEKLEAEHGRIAHVRAKEDNRGDVAWEVVLRKPKRAEVKMFRAQSHNPAQQSEAQEILTRKICVYPSIEKLDALLEDGWAIGEACGPALNRLIGVGVGSELVEQEVK